MIRAALVLATLVSVVLFPWPVMALLTLAASLYLPLLPVAAGLFSDAFYYNASAALVPLGTLFGLTLTALSYVVRSRLDAGIIGE